MASQCQTIDKSIIEYMTENQERTEFVKQIYNDWKELLDSLEINLNIRKYFDPWFMKCYNQRDSFMVQELFSEFLKGSEAEINDFLLKQEIYAIRKLSSESEWVQRAIECVRHEKELIQKHIETQKSTKHREHHAKLDTDVTKAQQLYKEIELKLVQTQKILDTFEKRCEEKEEAQKNLCGLNEVMKRKKQSEANGKILNKHQLESTIENSKSEIAKLEKEMTDCKTNLLSKFVEIVHHLQQLVPRLEQEVKTWQTQYKLKFAELAGEPDLERIDAWCGDIGLILYDMERVRLAKWLELCKDLYTPEELSFYQKIHQIVQPLCYCFISRTFIVIDQDDFIVKTDKKHLPKIKIRGLALNKVDLTGVKVSAIFAREEVINACWDPDKIQINIADLANCSLKMNQQQLTVDKKKKSKDKFEVLFDKLAFKEQFSRTATDRKPFVHEEKYRVVFYSVIENSLQLSTLSLPMVVTTGANQGCCALASVMWQCYSTDVFALPIQCRPSMPWSDVAGMLQAKISKLSSKRKLSKQNINHLKRRLLGSDQKPDDTEVLLNQFCFDKLNKSDDPTQQHSFSFWKWFLANYNLLDKYLKQYWEDGLIAGFLSKDDVEQMFRAERIHRQGVFILRFSDNHINDSQGTNSVFGFITAMVSGRCVEEDAEKKYKVISTEVADHKKLKDKNLANILKESLSKSGHQIYRYLYPGNRSREDYFDKYCKEGTVVVGYKGPQDAFIVDLEQDMCALKISTGKHRRSSIDSGIDPMSPASQVGNKKVKSGSTVSHPTIVNLLSNSCSNIGSPGQHSFVSTPHASPAYGSLSPNPTLSPTPSQPSYDPVSPAASQTLQSQLPTMVQNGFDDVDGAALNSQNVFTTISGHDYSIISSANEQLVLATSNQMLSTSPLMTEARNNGTQVLFVDEGYIAGTNYDNMSSCQFGTQIPVSDGSQLVNQSPFLSTQCQETNQIQQLIAQMTRDPQQLDHLLNIVLSQLRSDQIQNIQQIFTSTQSSPAHPLVETDSTSMDFVGQQNSGEIFLSNEEIESGRHANSGNIDVNFFNDLPEKI